MATILFPLSLFLQFLVLSISFNEPTSFLASAASVASGSTSARFSLPSSIPDCLTTPYTPSNYAGPSSPTPTCFDNDNSPKRFITLVLSRMWLPGFPKAVVAVNGTYPGPNLEFNQFDLVSVTVINNLDNDTSLHFHGMRQYRTPHQDGVLSLTQCPVPINSTLTYTFCADRSGSYWYHGHRSEQYTDGLYGVYVIHPYPQEIYKPQYDLDIPILMADWYNVPADSLLPYYLSAASGGIEPVPDAFIMNGFFSGQLSYSLPASSKVRIRFISSAAFSIFTIAIDGLTMTVIEVDGVDTKPYDVTSIPLNVAQRVSVLVDLSELTTALLNTGSIYIRATASLFMFDTDKIPSYLNSNPVAVINVCKQTTATGACSALSLASAAPGGTLVGIPSRFTLLPPGTFSAPMYSSSAPTPTTSIITNTPLDINMLQVVPLYPAYQKNTQAACYYQYDAPVAKVKYVVPLVLQFQNNAFLINVGQFSGITFDPTQHYSHLYEQPLASPAPLLYDMMTQKSKYYSNVLHNMNQTWLTMNDASMEQFVEGLLQKVQVDSDSVNDPSDATSTSNASFSGASAWHVIQPTQLGQYLLPGNETIEYLIVNTDTGSHPIHLHGYAFWIVASSQVPTYRYPYMIRDVLSLPPGGWIRFRILTDNPGAWLLHCHITWHMEAGLAAVMIDNLDALQNDPAYNVDTLVGQDAINNCQAFNPTIPPPPIPAGGIITAFVGDHDFVYGGVSVSTAAQWSFTACVIIMLESFLGWIMYKLKLLDYCLGELICMNIGTLVGAVFIEFLKELYEQVNLYGTLSYVNVAAIMCIGFLFPFTVEKFFKRGKTNKFQLAGGVPSSSPGNDKDKDLKKKRNSNSKSKSKNTSRSNGGENDSDIKVNANRKTTDRQNISEIETPCFSPSAASALPPPASAASAATAAAGINNENNDNDNVSLDVNNNATVNNDDVNNNNNNNNNLDQRPEVVFHFDAARPLPPPPLPPVAPPPSDDSTSNLASFSSPSPSPTSPSPASPLVSRTSIALVQRASLMEKRKRTSIFDQQQNKYPNSDDDNNDDNNNGKNKSKEVDHRRGSSADMEQIASALTKEKVDWNLIFIILAGEAIDTFVDGGIIAAAFLASPSTGLASSIGVFMEELPHMTGSFAVFVAAGAPLWKCVVINMLSSCFLLLGAAFILGTSTIPSVDPVKMDYLLAFASGSYLYVALVDLTPLITYQPWPGYFRAFTAVLSICFGMGIQASLGVYHWKAGTS